MTYQPRIDPDALDALLAPYDSTGAPGFAVGVALDGRPRYRRGVGLASIELPVALSPTIRMRIGSTSKHFCALALLLLEEEGRLSIDASPRTILPELPGWADGMTIRQLMAHTSGMRDSMDLLMLSAPPTAPVAKDVQFEMLCRLDSVNFAPGHGWNYNNGGYVLLSLIAERVSGLPLGELLRARIFEPLGMADTLLRPLDTDLVPNSATLHVPRADGGWDRGVMGAPIKGEGGIVSTVDDMLRWLAHMRDPVVGSAASWAAMRTPCASHGYGLGLMMDAHRGLATVHHAGGVIGGACQMLKVAECDLDLIVMTNGRNALELYGLVDAILDLCIPGLPPAPVPPDGPTASGTFHSRDTGRVVALAEQAGTAMMTVNGMTLPAHRDANGAYYVAIMPTDLRASVDEDASALTLVEFGATDRLHRVDPPEGEEVAAGRYRSDASGLTATLAGTGMTIAGPAGTLDYSLQPLGPDLWQGVAKSILPVMVTLETDAAGFLLTSGRTIRLRFERAA